MIANGPFPSIVCCWTAVAVIGLSGIAVAEPVTVKRTQMLMGTLVDVTAVAADKPRAHQAATAALSEIRRLEGLLSTWIATSDLSRVNAMAGQEPVHVGPETLDLLDRALMIASLTDGRFNILVGPVTQAWNVVEESRVPDPERLEQLRPLLDLSQLRLDASRGTAFLAKPGMRVDVGGIGKGFAADRAASAMQRAGATAGVVAVAGDIVTFGDAFVFGVQHPRRPDALLGRLALQNEAISTSGDYERYFERNGVRYHHIVDPQTLQPADGCQSVTVVARDAAFADGLATGLFILGPERARDVLAKLPAAEAIIVDQKGSIWVSPSLRARFQLEGSSL